MLTSSPTKIKGENDPNGSIAAAENEEFIEPELDHHTQIALKITGTLKELTMKQKIKELIFSRFKN